MINIRSYSSVNGDWTPAFNQAIQDCLQSQSREIYFPYEVTDNQGNYSFKTKPTVIGAGITLRGENPRQFLIRDYQPTGVNATPDSSFLVWDGSAFNGDPNQNKGGGIKNLGLGAGHNTSGGTAWLITGADTNRRPGYMYSENVVISFGPNSNGSWWGNLMIKGQSVQTAGSQGMRDLSFKQLYCFRATGENVHVTNGVHVFFDGIVVADGGVNNPNNGVRINGLGTPSSNSTQILLSNCDIEGKLSLTACSRVFASGYVNEISTDTSATQWKFAGLYNINNAAPGGVII